MTVIDVRGGAAINTTTNAVTLAIIDDGDVSAPAAPLPPALARATGGLLEMSVSGVDPLDTGGAAETIVSRQLLKLDPTGDWIPVDSVTSGLAAGSVHYFSVRVSNSLFTSKASAVAAVSTTAATVPSAARDLQVQHATGGSILVSWTAPEDLGGVLIDRYTVYTYDVVQGTQQVIPASVAIHNGDVEASTSVWLSVRHGLALLVSSELAVFVAAENSAGVGELSGVLWVSTLPHATLPTAPGLEVQSTRAGSVDLHLLPPKDFGGTATVSYLVFMRLPLVGDAFMQVANTTSASVSVTNLKARTTYTLVAQAENTFGDRCVDGVSAGLSPGERMMRIFIEDASVNVTALVAMLNVANDGATLRIETVAGVVFASVAANVEMADVLRGSVPLKATWAHSALDRTAVCMCGTLSEVVQVQTLDVGLPDLAPVPQLAKATGGRLELELLSPQDTGGSPVTSFALLLEPHDPEGLRQHVSVDTELSPSIGADGALRFSIPAVKLQQPVWEESVFVGAYVATTTITGLPALSQFDVSVQVATSALQCIAENDLNLRTVTTTTAPTLPTNAGTLLAQAMPGAVKLSWGVPFDRGGLILRPYLVQVSAGTAATPWISLTGATTSPHCVVYGLAPDTSYRVRIAAANLVGLSNWQEATVVTPEPAKPDPVALLTVSHVTGGAFTISWCPPMADGGTAVSHYTVFVKSDNDAAWTSVDVPQPPPLKPRGSPFIVRAVQSCTVSLTLRNRASNTHYTMRVIAHSIGGFESDAAVAEATTAVSTPASPPIALSQTSSTGGSVSMSWSAPDDDGGSPVVSYTVVVRDGGLPAPQELSVPVPATGAIGSVVLYGLLNNRRYRVQVAATNEAGLAGAVAEASAITQLVATTPGFCYDFEVTQRRGGSLSVAWRPPLDQGGYNVSRYGVRFGTMPSETVAGTLTVGVPSVLIEGLEPETSYWIAVSAETAWRAGAFTNPFVTQTSAASTPHAPRGLRFVQVSPSSGVLTCTPGESGGSPIVAFAATVSHAASGQQLYQLPASSVCSFQLEQLEFGTEYTVVVTAANVVGNSPPSTPFVYTHTRSRLAASLRAALVRSSSVDVEWDAPAPADGVLFLGYRVRLFAIFAAVL